MAEHVDKSGYASDSYEGIPKAATPEEFLRSGVGRLLPKVTHSCGSKADAVRESRHRFYPTILRLRIGGFRAEENDRVRIILGNEDPRLNNIQKRVLIAI